MTNVSHEVVRTVFVVEEVLVVVVDKHNRVASPSRIVSCLRASLRYTLSLNLSYIILPVMFVFVFSFRFNNDHCDKSTRFCPQFKEDKMFTYKYVMICSCFSVMYVYVNNIKISSK